MSSVYKIVYILAWSFTVFVYIWSLFHYGIVELNIQDIVITSVLFFSLVLNYFSFYYCLCVVKLNFSLWSDDELIKHDYNELVPSNTLQFRLIKAFSTRISVIFSVVTFLYLLIHFLLLRNSGVLILHDDFNLNVLLFGLMFPLIVLIFLAYIFFANRFLVYAIHKKMIEESIALHMPKKEEISKLSYDEKLKYINLASQIRKDRRVLSLSGVAGVLVSISSIIGSIILLYQNYQLIR